MLRPDERAAVLALAAPAQEIRIDAGSVLLSPHAVQRYRERVEHVSRPLAVRRLGRLLAGAEWQRRPRAWTTAVLHPDVIYGYSPDRPDVCLLVRKRVLVTVLSRRFLAASVDRSGPARCG